MRLFTNTSIPRLRQAFIIIGAMLIMSSFSLLHSQTTYMDGSLECTRVDATNVPIPLLDTFPIPNFSLIDFPITRRIERVRILDLQMAYDFFIDMDIVLSTPGFTLNTLFFEDCFDGAGLDVNFMDGGNAIACPAIDSQIIAPFSPLSTLNGLTSSGTWALQILISNPDPFFFAELQSWSLEVCYEPGLFCDSTLMLTEIAVPQGTYYASQSITANGLVLNGDSVVMQAPMINLDEGFEVRVGSQVTAKPGDCPR